VSLLIVEGPDGSGKTSLIEKVRAGRPGATVLHHGAYAGETDIARHYMQSLVKAIMEPDELTVFDRSWLAEPIYGHAARGGADRISEKQRAVLNNLAIGAGAMLVLCLPPLEACRRAWAARLETEYLKRESQLAEVWRLYSAAAHRWRDHFNVTLYDYTRGGEDALLEQIHHFAGGPQCSQTTT
jgi:thymidylate kinase